LEVGQLPRFANLPALTPTGRKELERLAGAWVLVEKERNGKKTKPEDLKGAEIRYDFRADQLHINSGTSEKRQATTWVEVGSGPSQIDLLFPERRSIQRGIYRLDGEALTLCLAGPDQERPTAFTAKEGSSHELLVFKRKSK
jgi:uncharacterized protein (TIGR03067 family)